MYTEEIQELIQSIEGNLKFYSEGGHYEWKGCKCHGNHNILDYGERADDALEELKLLINILEENKNEHNTNTD